jgi:hypothetical protein
MAFFTVFYSSNAMAGGAAPLLQAPPVAQRPKFFTNQRIILLSVGAAMMAADLITTERALNVPGAREANPLGQSEAARFSLKFAGFGAGLGISYALNRTGHYKAAHIVPSLIGVPSFAAAIHNATIHR